MSAQRNGYDVLLLRDILLRKLAKASEERSKREDWILFERQTMLDGVNAARSEIRLDPITIGEIERVERLACGHSDYSSKFALYCAELAYDMRTILATKVDNRGAW